MCFFSLFVEVAWLHPDSQAERQGRYPRPPPRPECKKRQQAPAHQAPLSVEHGSKVTQRHCPPSLPPSAGQRSPCRGCRDQEGRRGSEEAVPGPSVFPSREPGVSGDFWGSHPWRRTRGSLRSSSCLGRKPPRAPQLEETPETPPSSPLP